MLGPLLPSLIERWHIQDAQAGTLFTWSFAGQLCGAWFGVRNLRASVLYGALLSAAGCAAMAWAGFGQAHLALFSVGVGIGAGLTAGNVIVGTFVPTAGARLLALLNVSWTIGAIGCPILVRACGPTGMGTFFYLTAAALLVAALFALRIPHRREPNVEDEGQPAPTAGTTRYRLPLQPVPLLVFTSAMLLYVGVENSLGGWLPSYAIRLNPSSRAATIALYFWVAQLAGRLLMAARSTVLSEQALYGASVVLLLVAQSVLLAANHLTPWSVTALTILSGLALAPLYPLILAFLLARTGSHPRLGALFASASLGGATLPWFTGMVSTRFHSLRIGLAVPASGALLLLLLSHVITRDAAAKGEAEARPS